MDFIIKALPLLLVAGAMAQYYEGYHRAPVHHQPHQELDEHEEYDTDYHGHPKYTFDYAVKDPHTGDDKEHWETRDGDKVKGSYTLTETDGTKRVVEYEADDKHGFNAVVHKIGTPKHDDSQEYQHKVQEYHPKIQEYHPKIQEYHPKIQEYHQKIQEYHPKIEEYEAKAAYEPLAYNHDYGHGDDGFVPIVGYGRH